MTNPAAGDCRRAAALVSHHASGYPGGVNAIIDEANQTDRGTQLFLAVLHAYQALVPDLRTDVAMAAMSQHVEQVAHLDENPDWRRAATAIIADSTTDVDRLNQTITEATHHSRTGQMLYAVLDLYAQLLPELATPLGIETLSAWTARIAGQEGAT